MTDRARILLFTGDGKGKTTAALGMVLRAAGHGMKTLILQFVKSDRDTGEIAACRFLPDTEIVQTGRGFVPDRTSPAFAGHREAAQIGWDLAGRAILSGRYALVVLDEICLAVGKDLIDENQVIDVIERAGPAICIVMTGRNATARLSALADTVTEMRPVRHGYAAGITAQKGVEY
jgi:cob(I)alamin adenosyltransferase